MTDPGYADAFIPREFQSQLIEAVVRDHDAGKKLTVGIASPGSGKTLAYQAAATSLLRRGAIDLVAVYAPRLALAVQCELEYRDSADQGHFELFDSSLRLESIHHRGNRPPLTSRGATRTGFVTTYSSLVSNPNVHLDWARRNQGRFLLVGDEAQFLGAADDEEGEREATKAAEFFAKMNEYAAHSVLLTGTEKRSDGSELVLAPYETRSDGKRYLIADVRARYSDGIAQGYLRRFEASIIDADVRRVHALTGESEQAALSINGGQLNQVLEQEHVWRPLTDKAVEKLKAAKREDSGYKALIACQRQEAARNVHRYLLSIGVKADISVSQDRDQASKTLDAFKFNDSDVLVTVRKAFIGYDCKKITVVGLLTNYRDQGHLEQLVGRGLRVSEGEPADSQWCRIVAPNDPHMMRFLEALEEERDQGLSRRPRPPRDPDEPDGPPPPPPEPRVIVEDAYATETMATGHAGYVDPSGMSWVDQVHETVPSSTRITDADLLKIRQLDIGQPMPQKPERRQGRLTREQQISTYKAEADKWIKKATNSRANYSPANPGPWSREKSIIHSELNGRLNRIHGVRSSEYIRDIDIARWYRDQAKGLALPKVGAGR